MRPQLQTLLLPLWCCAIIVLGVPTQTPPPPPADEGGETGRRSDSDLVFGGGTGYGTWSDGQWQLRPGQQLPKPDLKISREEYVRLWEEHLAQIRGLGSDETEE